MKVVELAGLPGCGKSTMLKQTDITDDIVKIFDYHRMLGMWVSTRARRSISKILTGVLPWCWKFNKLLQKFSNEYDNVSENTIIAFRVLYMQTRIIPLFCPKAVAVLDEGFAQMITSVTHGSDIKTSDTYVNFADYIKEKNDIYVVDCNCSMDVCLQRLRKRNGKDRFNSVKDDKELVNILRQKRSNLTKVVKSFTCIYSVNTDCVTSEELDILSTKIKGVYKQ